MKPCIHVSRCKKIKSIQDKGMLDSHPVESVEDICGKCNEREIRRSNGEYQHK